MPFKAAIEHRIKYKQARSKVKCLRYLFRKKSNHLDEEALIEFERQRNIQNMCKFNKRLDDTNAQKEKTLKKSQRQNSDFSQFIEKGK
jgi:hypothetical protein